MNDNEINRTSAQEVEDMEATLQAEEHARFIEAIESSDAKELEGLLNCEISSIWWLGDDSGSSYSIDEDGCVWLLDVFGDAIDGAGQVSPEALSKLTGAR